MKPLITSLLLCLSINLIGQNILAQADHYYRNYEFEKCIPLYLEAFSQNDVDTFYTKTRLADSYRKTDNMLQAAHWYSQTLNHSKTKPIYYLYYSYALECIGECDSAKVYFEIYDSLEPDIKFGKRQFKCKYQTLINVEKRNYQVNLLPFNTKYDEISVAFYKGNLLFSTLNDEPYPKNTRIHPWSNYSSFFELYQSKIDTLNASYYKYAYDTIPQKTNLVSNKYHDFDAHYDSKNSRLFFTRNNIFIKKNEIPEERNKIFYGILENDKLTKVSGLPFNSDEYSIKQPFITNDGTTLYFASNMPGGFGGFDIYKSNWEKWNDEYQWSPPTNLGSDVNTEFDEINPYLNEYRNKLYFSSNREESFGGFDIFYLNFENDRYHKLMQLPKPINSDSNEIDFIINEAGVFGYIISDRNGEKSGYDIYSFLDNSVEVEVLVYELATNKPMPNLKVYCEFTKDTLMTNQMGRIYYYIPINTNTSFEAFKDSFIAKSIEASTERYEPASKMFVKIPLAKRLDFNISGTITDNHGCILSDVKVILYNDCDEKEQSFITKEDGKYEFKKLPNQCCFRIKAIAKSDNYLYGTKHKICTRGKVDNHDFDGNIELTRTGDFIFLKRNYIQNLCKANFVYEGILKNEKNEPLKHVTFTLKNERDGEKYNIQTDNKGRFFFQIIGLQDCFTIKMSTYNYRLMISDKENVFCPSHLYLKNENLVIGNDNQYYEFRTLFATQKE